MGALPSMRFSALRRREQSPGLRAAWGFDEGSGTTARDSSLNNLPLTVDPTLNWVAGHTGGTAISNPGVIGNARRTWTTLASPITMMGWVRPLNLAAGTQRPLFGIWSAADVTSSTQFALWAQRNDFSTSNVLQGNVRVDGGLVAVNGSALALNTWVHIALSYDGSTIRLYRDGIEVAQFAITGAITGGSFQFITAPNPGVADIDDVRIYSIALSLGQIKNAMNDPIAAP